MTVSDEHARITEEICPRCTLPVRPFGRHQTMDHCMTAFKLAMQNFVRYAELQGYQRAVVEQDHKKKSNIEK
jgi:hypothetical protein